MEAVREKEVKLGWGGVEFVKLNLINFYFVGAVFLFLCLILKACFKRLLLLCLSVIVLGMLCGIIFSVVSSV